MDLNYTKYELEVLGEEFRKQQQLLKTQIVNNTHTIDDYPQCREHVAARGEVITQYIDGSIVGQCYVCGGRMEIPWIPGGLSALKLRDLAAEILASDEPSAEHVLEFNDAVDNVKKDLRAIRSALGLAETIDQVIRNKFLQKIASTSEV